MPRSPRLYKKERHKLIQRLVVGQFPFPQGVHSSLLCDLDRCSFVRVLSLRFPPIFPPFRPIFAIYCEMFAGGAGTNGAECAIEVPASPLLISLRSTWQAGSDHADVCPCRSSDPASCRYRSSVIGTSSMTRNSDRQCSQVNLPTSMESNPPAEIKSALTQIAKKEGRSLAQVCELLLRGGIHEYDREGSKYLRRFVERQKEKSK
jgi:hypothetical protein